MPKRDSRDDLDRFHEYGVHIPTRTLYLGSLTASDEGESGVDAFMVERIAKNLRVLDAIAKEPITIIMNNPGGDMYHGFAIYDAIVACRSHVTIEVLGHAMSMGSVILQAADERVMHPNSSQMIHYGTLAFSGHSKTGIKWADQEKKLSNKMEQIYLAKMKKKDPLYTLQRLRHLLDHDTFLSAEESVKLGLADKVLKQDG